MAIGKFIETLADAQTGRPLANAEVLVYEAGTTTPATRYLEDGVTEDTAPVITDWDGLFFFHAEAGTYDLKAAFGGVEKHFTSVLVGPYPAGPGGEKGDTGSQGPIGATGPRGLKGETGDTGPTGPTGPEGPAGPLGESLTATHTAPTPFSPADLVVDDLYGFAITTGKAFAEGMELRLASSGVNYFDGIVDDYDASTGSLSLVVKAVTGNNSATTWAVTSLKQGNHAAVTVVNSESINLSLVGQQITASANFGTTAETVARGNHDHGGGVLGIFMGGSYGAIGDGSSHTLASAGYTLAAAQAKWPGVTITSTDQEVDFCALQQAVIDAETADTTLWLEPKRYFLGEKILSSEFLIVKGQGKGQSTFGVDIHRTTFHSSHQGIMWEAPTGKLQLYDLAFHFVGTPTSAQMGLMLGSDVSGPNFYGRCTNVRFTNNYLGCKVMSNNFGGFEWCTFRNNTYCGLWIENDYSSDRNSGTITNCEFTDEFWTSTYLCYIKQGSLWFITDNDWLRGNNQLYIEIPNPVDGVDTAETDFFINHNSFEDSYLFALYMKDNRNPTHQIGRVHIHDNESYNNRRHDLFYLDGIYEYSITGNTLNCHGGDTADNVALLKLRNCSHGVILGNVFGSTLNQAAYAIDVDATVTDTNVGTNHNGCATYVNGTGGDGFQVGDSVDLTDIQLASGELMQISKDITDGNPVVRVYGYGEVGGLTSCTYQLNAAAGTQESPTGLGTSDKFGAFSFRGRHATGWPTYAQALIAAQSTQTQTASAQGSEIILETTPNNSTTRLGAFLITNDGFIQALRSGGGVKFYDNTTQTTAVNLPANALGVLKNNGSGGLSWVGDSGFPTAWETKTASFSTEVNKAYNCQGNITATIPDGTATGQRVKLICNEDGGGTLTISVGYSSTIPTTITLGQSLELVWIHNLGWYLYDNPPSAGSAAAVTHATSVTTPLVQGGTDSGGALSLSSTSHGTKGKINLGSASTYDEANDRLGIGTTTPAYDLHLHSNGSGNKVVAIGLSTNATTVCGYVYGRRSAASGGAIPSGMYLFAMAVEGTTATNTYDTARAVFLCTATEAWSSTVGGFSTKVRSRATGGLGMTDSITCMGTVIRPAQGTAPANNAAGTAGDMIFDAAGGYIYVCTGLGGTNNWKRMALSTY